MVSEKWNYVFSSSEIFLKVFSLIYVTIIAPREKYLKVKSTCHVNVSHWLFNSHYPIQHQSPIHLLNQLHFLLLLTKSSLYSKLKHSLKHNIENLKINENTLLFMKAFKHFTHSCCIFFSTFPSLSQASLKCLSKIFIPSSPNSWIQLWINQKTVSLQMSHNYGYKLSTF